MGAGDNKKVCYEAATAPKILWSEKRKHPISGESNVFPASWHLLASPGSTALVQSKVLWSNLGYSSVCPHHRWLAIDFSLHANQRFLSNKSYIKCVNDHTWTPLLCHNFWWLDVPTDRASCVFPLSQAVTVKGVVTENSQQGWYWLVHSLQADWADRKLCVVPWEHTGLVINPVCLSLPFHIWGFSWFKSMLWIAK